jgi:transposase
MTDYREILRLATLGLTRTSIGEALGYSRNTVAEVIRRATLQGVSEQIPEGMSDKELAQLLYPEKQKGENTRMPDYEKVHKELGRKGVTLTLLWDEYCEECRNSNEIPYGYGNFVLNYHKFARSEKATMHLNHKPGEVMQVDWAGVTACIQDGIIGEVLTANIFVATLPCSGYSYAEAFLNQNQESWTAAHINALEYFGGSPRILVPDNLKTGVDNASRNELVINKTYNELAEHYGCAVIPARVKKPKDKAAVEGAVGNISTWIIAALRNTAFFTLFDLNEAIKDKLLVFNGFRASSETVFH